MKKSKKVVKKSKKVSAKKIKKTFEVGKSYFIRTVTMIQIGELVYADENELLLRNASWIPDTDRFMDGLINGTVKEAEPFIDDVIVNRKSIIDATIWRHKLPMEQK